MTPLVLLVGFLGSGKTTYLRRLLPELKDRGLDPHVIINDYQNAKVDAQLLQDLAESIVPISGSCVCCGSRDELLSTLESFKHQPGRVLVVETNGTTDSEELIELLSLEPSLNRFTLPVQISIIDGTRWQKRFWHNALELDQARTATHIYVSRFDEIDEKQSDRLAQSFEKHDLTRSQTDPASLADELVSISRAVADLPSRDVVAHQCGCGGHHHDHEHHEEHNHEERSHHFASMQIDLPARVQRRTLEGFLSSLPEEVIRAKGLVRLADSPEEYHIFQKVERHVQLLPIGSKSRIENPVAVLIGPHLPESSIRESASRHFADSV